MPNLLPTLALRPARLHLAAPKLRDRSVAMAAFANPGEPRAHSLARNDHPRSQAAPWIAYHQLR